jgi:hypothetical protein
MNLRLAFVAVALGGLSCGVTESGTIALIYGPDDPFTEKDAAAPTSIRITALDADGGDSEAAAVTLARSPYRPGATVSLPSRNADETDVLQATFLDSANAAVIFGQTIPVELEAIQNATLDLFVQRTGQFARLPSPFAAAPASPLASVLENHYVLIADGSGRAGATQAALYNMNGWGFVEGVSPLPCAPLSIAPLGGSAILILCAAGTANASGCEGSGVVACGFDFTGAIATETLTPPEICGGWSGVAGGATVVTPGGAAFIVGGTRNASSGMGPTRCVLRMAPSDLTPDAGFFGASLTMVSLGSARLGAAAAWSPRYGLVVAGGNPGSTDPSVEYTGPDVADGAKLPAVVAVPGYSGDVAQGSGAAVLGSGDTLVVAGGVLPDKSLSSVRVFDLRGCDGGCDAGVGPEAGADGGLGISVPLVTAQGFAVGPSSALFVGAGSASAEGGVTQAFLASTSSPGEWIVTHVPLRVSNRRDTTAIWSPVSSVLVVGGDTTIESFVP